jgi:four helix bundle protein
VEVRHHRDLFVWQKSMDLVETCYRLTKSFPDHERFGLTSQLRRAVVSVPANIAEGFGRQKTGAYVHHLSIASGSLAEVETLLLIAVRLEYLTKQESQAALSVSNEIGKMLGSLRSKLASRNSNS